MRTNASRVTATFALAGACGCGPNVLVSETTSDNDPMATTSVGTTDDISTEGPEAASEVTSGTDQHPTNSSDVSSGSESTGEPARPSGSLRFEVDLDIFQAGDLLLYESGAVGVLGVWPLWEDSSRGAEVWRYFSDGSEQLRIESLGRGLDEWTSVSVLGERSTIADQAEWVMEMRSHIRLVVSQLDGGGQISREHDGPYIGGSSRVVSNSEPSFLNCGLTPEFADVCRSFDANLEETGVAEFSPRLIKTSRSHEHGWVVMVHSDAGTTLEYLSRDTLVVEDSAPVDCTDISECGAFVLDGPNRCVFSQSGWEGSQQRSRRIRCDLVDGGRWSVELPNIGAIGTISFAPDGDGVVVAGRDAIVRVGRHGSIAWQYDLPGDDRTHLARVAEDGAVYALVRHGGWPTRSRLLAFEP